jgi:hypothetical protein
MWNPGKEIFCNLANTIGDIRYPKETPEINLKKE